MKIEDHPRLKIVELIPRIDGTTVHKVNDVLTDLMDNGHIKIICDFSQNEYISSAGLRAFLSALKRTKKVNGKLVLCALRPGILEIFNMAGFTQLFTIYDSQQEAVDYLRDMDIPASQKNIVSENYLRNPSLIRQIDEKV